MKDADTMVLPRLGPAEVSDEDPWEEGRDDVPDRPVTDKHNWRIAAWLLPALLMGAGGLIRTGAPGPRLDELTVAPYHLLVRVWAEVFGTSDLALRGPSIVAMTAAAALVGALASRMFTPGTGVVAGVLFALLPTSARYAQEIQPYALTLLAAVLATWLLRSAADQPSFWRFAGYGASVVLLGLCQVGALLLLVGHGWTVFAFRRDVALRWLVAAGLGVLPAAGLLRYHIPSGTQHPPVSAPSLSALAATPGQLFGVAALGAVLLVLALFSLPLRYPAALFTAWAVAPPLGMLLIAQVAPVWLPQSLLFTLPAWATLGAVALTRVRGRW